MNIFTLFKQASLLKKIAVIILGCYLIVWSSSSTVIKHFATPILADYGLSINGASRISYNPFLTEITVSDLTLLKDEQRVLVAQQLTLRLTLLRLLFDEIAISKLVLNDGYLAVSQLEQQLLVAGVNVSPQRAQASDESNNQELAVSENSTSDKAADQASDSNTSATAYQILLPKLTLNNFIIDIDNNGILHQVNLQKLVVSDVIVDALSQQVNISIDSIIDQAEVSLVANAKLTQGQGDIYSKLAIKAYPLQTLSPYVKELSQLAGLFSFSSEQTLSIQKSAVQLHLKEANISSDDVVAGIAGTTQQFISIDNITNTIADIKVILSENQLTSLSGASQLSITNTNIFQGDNSQKLAHIDQVTLKDISFHLEQVATIKIASLSVDNLLASKNEHSELPPIAQLKQLSVNDIILSEQVISVDKITLDNLISHVIINKDKALANLVAMPANDTAISERETTEIADTVPEANTDETDTGKTPPDKINDEVTQVVTDTATPTFSLGEFTVINDSQLSFVDESVQPAYERTVFIDTFTIGALTNSDAGKEQPTPINIAGRSNKYAHFNFKGFSKPFANTVEHHLAGSLKELSLPAISSYMKEALQLELKTGQFSTNVDLTIIGEELDGEIVILLQGLETAIADTDEVDSLIDQGALPLNMAIGMLKDSKGDVELGVPLSGALSDPQFGVSSIMTLITQKAIWMATQDYLMTTFVPYANIVSMSMSVGEFVFKLRFDDLPYQPAQISPEENQQAYLTDFIALLHDKADTRVNLCAVSTATDIGKTSGAMVTDKADIQRLKNIADQRAQALKSYLVEQGKIDSARLLLCAPQIDSNDAATPRVVITV